MKDELFDEELCNLVKFTDTTGAKTPKFRREVPAPIPSPKVEVEVEESQCIPPKPKANWMDKTKACTKDIGVISSISLLLFYWQQSGQLKDSAAIPSFIVLALLAGLVIGKNWSKRYE